MRKSLSYINNLLISKLIRFAMLIGYACGMFYKKATFVEHFINSEKGYLDNYIICVLTLKQSE